MRVKSKFDFYSDAGHGWLKVHILMLQKMGIDKNVTSFSYIHGGDVFLEEDCDAPMFMKKYEELFGKKPELNYHTTDKRSRIRNYHSY